MGHQHDEAMAREIADNQSDENYWNHVWDHEHDTHTDYYQSGCGLCVAEEKVALNLKRSQWRPIPDSRFSIMTNGSGELFVRFGDKELRMGPSGRDGFVISDWNSPGKLQLDGRIYVR